MGEALMHVVCPECEQPIELPAQGAGERIQCPTCGKDFIAKGMVSLMAGGVPAPKPPEPKPKIESAWGDKEIAAWNAAGQTSLTRRADALWTWAVWALLLGGLSLLIGGLAYLTPDNPNALLNGAKLAGGFAGLAVLLLLFSQLMHIRAALEKLNKED